MTHALAGLVVSSSTTAPRLLVQLAEAAGADDVDGLRRHAHTLKSNAASFGATDLAERCAALEAQARAGEVEDAEGQVGGIASAFDAARRGPGGVRMTAVPATVLVVDDDPLEPIDAVDVARPGGASGGRSRQRARGDHRPRAAVDRPRADRHRDARDGRLRTAGAPGRRRAAAGDPVHRDLRRRGDGLDHRLHQARRRGLPPQALRPGAAPRPARRLPRQEADDRRAPRPERSSRRAGGREGAGGRAAQHAATLRHTPARRGDRLRRRRHPGQPPSRDHGALLRPARVHGLRGDRRAGGGDGRPPGVPPRRRAR